MNKVIKMFKFLSIIPKKIEILALDFYKKYISNSLGCHCKYYPTCSVYLRQAVDKYGIIKGNILGIYRIIRCNPFSRGGIDYLK